ncbi:Methyltransferase-like protein 21B [Entomophthora muscae]|uniref:Methyltransferase-like protein 21B n=1 Tax=Entomophthora muscae TaxID=34485 RepID=A0ACC2RM00_9FUNG|nr:Methyltransferase-like protein 21B [Entomophthora muscae]
MELVKWKYCNPYSNQKYSATRSFQICGRQVLINQLPEEDITLDSNTGNVVWDGAYVMCKYLENVYNWDKLKDCSPPQATCLELGSGTGLAGLTAWLKGVDVYLSDLPTKTGLLESNIATNRHIVTAQNSIQAVPLDWYLISVFILFAT